MDPARTAVGALREVSAVVALVVRDRATVEAQDHNAVAALVAGVEVEARVEALVRVAALVAMGRGPAEALEGANLCIPAMLDLRPLEHIDLHAAAGPAREVE